LVPPEEVKLNQYPYCGTGRIILIVADAIAAFGHELISTTKASAKVMNTDRILLIEIRLQTESNQPATN